MLTYPKLVQFVKQVFSLTLRKTRLENLQLRSFGLLRGQSCCLSRIARFFPLPTEHNDRLRRLWRFLRNPGFLPEQLYPQPLRALAPCWPAQKPLPLALDWTSAAGYELLVAALPWRGRALPLWAQVCRANWQGLCTSRNRLEHAFIAAVTTALRAVRPQIRLVWIADRGFARLSLFQCSAKEPWYLVTTLESAWQARAYYRRRMRIEEGFKDWKQRLGLRQAAVSTVERMESLVAGLVLATVVLALLGLFGLPAGFPRAVLGRGKGSWLWLALQSLEQAKPPELGRALQLAANLGRLQ
jgi:hypothetical protein